jgi:hypothetical protein
MNNSDRAQQQRDEDRYYEGLRSTNDWNRSWTINVIDPNRKVKWFAQEIGYHAYDSDGVTAIEIKGTRKYVQGLVQIWVDGADDGSYIAYIYE